MIMKFDFVIGNPPYQDETLGDNKGYAPPVYHKFLESAYEIGEVVEMIHPARFLFNAGSTPKQWNEQMLQDPHLKVLYFEQDSSKVFSNTDIKGGVVITHHDKKKEYGAIGVFTTYKELNSIFGKVENHIDFSSFGNIVVTAYAYRMTDKMHTDHPEVIELLSNGHAYDLKSNIFEKLPQIFLDEKPSDGEEYIQILGREKFTRVYKYVRRDYINMVCNLDKYKIFLPSVSGIGTLGETLATPILCGPMVGTTETFMGIGSFETENEAKAAMKYIKTKFVRVLLGILKTTQHISTKTWEYVPLQDFTMSSDINWSVSIPDIDKQLYSKYELSEEEINFIESKVKEME